MRKMEKEVLKENVVYVIGHKRPDTDAIASAISCAYLKNLVDPEREYQAVRLGEINLETEFVLSYFGLEVPPLLEHVYQCVKDAMTRDVIMVHYKSTICEVGDLMISHQIRDVPLVNDKRQLVGLVTERKIARNFLREFRDFSLEEYPPRVADVVKTMDARLVVGNMESEIKGRPMIGAMSPEKVKQYLKKGDVLITGDREDVQEIGIQCGISCLIVTGDTVPSERILQMAREKNITVIVTPHTTYVAGRLLRLSSPAERIMEKDPLTTAPDTLLRDFVDELMEDKNGVAVVIDEDRVVKGIITRHDLINPRRKQVILVDHSEKSQTVDGIEEAEILEIIDHHRLGGLETGQPVTAYIKPVGCTCTILWEQYKIHNVKPSFPVAGAMLAAILSDTMLLKSPTTTQQDRETVVEIARFLKIDPLAFGMQMYRAKMNFQHLPPREILTMDLKESRFPRGTVAVSQVEVIEPDVVLSRRDELIEEMEKMVKERGYILFLFMITDVLKESTTMLAAGQVKLAEKAFRIPFENNTAYMPGVVSRKKQVIPVLSRSL